MNLLLFLAAFLSGTVFTGGLVAHRIKRNRNLAAVECALIKLGNSLAIETDDEDAYDRLRVFERYMDDIEDGRL